MVFDFLKWYRTNDNRLDKTTFNDGPPRGLEYNLILKSQDYTDLMENLEKYKVISKIIDGETATLALKYAEPPEMVYCLSRIKKVSGGIIFTAQNRFPDPDNNKDKNTVNDKKWSDKLNESH